MIYALKNNSASVVSLNSKLTVTPATWHVIYDSTLKTVSSDLGDLIDSCSIVSSEPSDNLNYCLHTGLVNFYIDGALQDKVTFYNWFNTLKQNYKYYSQFIAQGFIETKLDNENGKIIFQNRELLVSDLPDNIDATKIANGTVNNLEFQTLNGINTSLTIQQQLDAKFDKNGTRVFRFTQSTPASYWLINHNLNCIPVCAVFDSTGEEILATVITLDENTTAVRFSKAYSGSCSLSY